MSTFYRRRRGKKGKRVRFKRFQKLSETEAINLLKIFKSDRAESFGTVPSQTENIGPIMKQSDWLILVICSLN